MLPPDARFSNGSAFLVTAKKGSFCAKVARGRLRSQSLRRRPATGGLPEAFSALVVWPTPCRRRSVASATRTHSIFRTTTAPPLFPETTCDVT